jgi:hypothetical protein
MARHILTFVVLLLLIGSWVSSGEAQVSVPNLADLDHNAFIDYDRPVKDQVRYLFGHWPRDFEIAVVESLGNPACDHHAESNCWLRVKPVEVILGHQHESTYVVSYRRASADARFDIKRGDRIVAMLTPMIRPARMPVSYIVTWFAHADGQLVDSVRNAVADDIMAGSRCQANH